MEFNQVEECYFESFFECYKENELTEDVLWTVGVIVIIHRKMIDPVAAPNVDPCAKHKCCWIVYKNCITL